MLVGDPNLEKSMTVCQGREEMLTPYCKLSEKNKKASTA